MSEQFYDRLLSLFFGFFLLLVLLNVDMQLLSLYLNSQNMLYYAGWLIVLGFSVIYSVKYYGQFGSFRDNLGLFLVNPDSKEEKLEPLELNLDNKALQVCLYYRNGATLEEMKEKFGFNHPNQPKRELIKGISFLLKFYDEHKQEVKT